MTNIPMSIKTHKYGFLFSKEWGTMHNSNAGNDLTVFTGAMGSGKSWACAKHQEILGVNSNEEPIYFNPDAVWNHICFSKPGFDAITNQLAKIKKSRTRGYQIMLDEAEVGLYSKKAMTKEVMDLTLKFATIRSRRWGIGLTLPTFGMLNADIRRLVNYFCIMTGKFSEDNRSISKIEFMWSHPVTGEIWRPRPSFMQSEINPITGCYNYVRYKLDTIAWEKPTHKVIRGYEKLKKEFQNKFYSEQPEETVKIIDSDLNKQSLNPEKGNLTKLQIADEVMLNMASFMNKEKYISPSKIKARFLVNEVVARNIALYLNEKIDKER